MTLDDQQLQPPSVSFLLVYQTAFALMDQGFCLLEKVNSDTQQPPDFRYLLVNPAFEKHTGLQDVVGKTIQEVVPEAQQSIMAIYEQVAASGQSSQFEAYVAPLDLWMEANVFRISPQPTQLAVLFTNITQRKQAEEALRRSAQRDAFLVKLTDALRPLAYPIAIQQAALSLIGQYLNLDRALYNEIDPDVTAYTTLTNYAREGFPAYVGRFAMAAFTETVKSLQRGETLVIDDVEKEERYRNERDYCISINVRSFVTVPLIKEGHWVVNLVVHDSKARQWTPDDVSILEETAERTWAAVERAKAEVALRASEEKYRTLYQSVDEGFTLIELIVNEGGQVVDFMYLENNPAFVKHVGLDLQGKRRSELFLDQRDFVLDQYEHLFRTGEPLHFEHHVPNLGGRWFQVTATRMGGLGSKHLGVVFRNITDRKHREANLALLAEVDQNLARLTNIDQTMNVLGEKIAAYLGLSAIVFAEMYAGTDERPPTAILSHGWHRPDVPSLLGTYRVDEFVTPELMQSCLIGEAVIIRDVFDDPRTDGEQCTGIKVGSFVTMPLVRNGEWPFMLVIYRSEAYNWREDEIALTHELTTRIWTRLERARAEEALHISEEKYRTLFDSIDEGFVTFELIYDQAGKPVDLLYLETNRVYERQTGLASVAGKTVLQVAPNLEQAWLDTLARVVETGEPVRFEDYHGDTNRWYNVFVSRIDGPGSRQIAMVFDDTTERKHREANLAFLAQISAELAPLLDSRQIMERVGKGLGDFLQLSRCVFSVVDQPADRITPLYEWRREDLTPSVLGSYPISALLTPEGKQHYGAGKMGIIPDTRDNWMLTAPPELLYESGNASIVDAPYLKNGRWTFLLTVVRSEAGEWRSDETELIEELAARIYTRLERALAEEALRTSEANLSALFTAVPVGIALMDAEGKIILSNAQMRRFLPNGLIPSQEGEHSWRWQGYYPNGQRVDVEDYPGRRAMRGETGEPTDFLYIADDGKPIWTLVNYLPVQEADGEPTRFVCVITDVDKLKRNAEALQDSEERFRTLVQNIRDYAIFRIDPNGIITEWTEGAERVKGYTFEDVIGKHLSMFYAPEDKAAGEPANELAEAARTGRAERIGTRIRKDGQRIIVDEIATAIRDSNGQLAGFTKISRDITARKADQERLHQSEQRTRLAVEAAGMATWDWDLVTDLVYWSEQHFLLLAMKPQQEPLKSEVFVQHVHPDDRDRITAELTKTIEERKVYDAEFRVVRDDGVTRWMSGYGRITAERDSKPVKVSGVMFDITDRKEAEESLLDSRQRLQIVLDSIADHAIITTDTKAIITGWNPGAQQLFGWTDEEALGQSTAIIFTPEDLAAGQVNKEMQLARYEGHAPDERYHIRKDGSRLYISGVLSPLYDADGQLLGYVKVARDLSERQRMEQALRETDRRKDEFLAMLAHELRNPLAPIRNGIQFISITNEDDPTLGSLLPVMNRQMDHLVRLVDDLLDVSRISRGKIELRKERIDLTSVVGQAVDAMRPVYASAGRQLSVQIPNLPLYLNGDATRLNQVVANLLTNGVRYTRENGQVWLSLEQVDGQAVLRVRDNGIGLAADQLKSIFELFVQVDTSLARSNGGLGLGLTLVQQLVEMHGGRAEAHSPGLDQGSEFAVYLPILHPENVS